MFGSEILNIVIGLVFIFLLYSLLATIVQEMIATNLAFRAKILEKAIARMLDDSTGEDESEWPVTARIKGFLRLFYRKKRTTKPCTDVFYGHPLVKYLAEDKWHSKPSYINSQNFSKVLIDLLKGNSGNPGDDLRSIIQQAITDGKLKWIHQGVQSEVAINPETLAFLKSVWADSQGDLEKFKVLIENWFDETMDRASGWYKKYAQMVLLVIGFGIAFVFNVDTIAIAEKLHKDPKLAEQLVQQADAFVKAHPNLENELVQLKEANKQAVNNLTDTLKRTDSLGKLNKDSEAKYKALKARQDTLLQMADSLVKTDIKKANDLLALGWDNYGGNTNFFCKAWYVIHETFSNWHKLLGFILTALAISLGAPFWFDLLNKLMKLRGSVQKKPEDESTTDSSKKTKIMPKG